MGKKSKRTRQSAAIRHVYAVVSARWLAVTGRHVLWCRFPVLSDVEGVLAIGAPVDANDRYLAGKFKAIPTEALQQHGTALWHIARADLHRGAIDHHDESRTPFWLAPWSLQDTNRDLALAAMADAHGPELLELAA